MVTLTRHPDLIYDVIACRWRRVYYESGAAIVDDVDDVLRNHGRSLDSFSSILDFGCGSGRLLRHVHSRTDAALAGSDYNPRLIQWCSKHLPFALFTTNNQAPPLQFEDDGFDLVYARSVLTHLPEDLCVAWMKEIHRVLKPGGLFYFTMHGEPLAAGLPSHQRQQFESGQMVVTYETVAGQNLCSTYAGRDFVTSNLLEGYRLTGFVEGRERSHLRQDIYLVEKT